MSPRFVCKDGNLGWDGWWWGSDDFARERMAKMVEVFETPGARCPSLAEECRAALAAYDAFWAEKEDEELRYITETAA